MKDDVTRTSRSALHDGDLEDANSSAYASGTGLLFVAVLIALSATGLSLLSLAHG